jgi:hypothetical protein
MFERVKQLEGLLRLGPRRETDVAKAVAGLPDADLLRLCRAFLAFAETGQRRAWDRLLWRYGLVGAADEVVAQAAARALCPWLATASDDQLREVIASEEVEA